MSSTPKLSLQELKQWEVSCRELYALAPTPIGPKAFEVTLGGGRYIVTLCGRTFYDGPDAREAVTIYNTIDGK
jgi:hypothetical protein